VQLILGFLLAVFKEVLEIVSFGLQTYFTCNIYSLIMKVLLVSFKALYGNVFLQVFFKLRIITGYCPLPCTTSKNCTV